MSLLTVIESNPQDLRNINFTTLNDQEKAYTRALMAYFDGNTTTLEREKNNLGMLNMQQQVNLLELRVSIRNQLQVEQSILDQLEVAQESEEWMSEIYCALGLYYFINTNFDKALSIWQKAVEYLRSVGSINKKLRIKKNILACETHLNPSHHYISDYLGLIKECEQYGQSRLAADCYTYISQQYALVGSDFLAERYSSKAIELLDLEDMTLDKALAYVQHAENLILTAQVDKAKQYIDEIRVCSFPEIQQAILKLENKAIDENKLTSSWKHKLLNKSDIKLTPAEENLFSIISQRPSTKDEIINELYGEDCNYLTAENKFKVLLSRFRKKVPHVHFNKLKKTYYIEEIQ